MRQFPCKAKDNATVGCDNKNDSDFNSFQHFIFEFNFNLQQTKRHKVIKFIASKNNQKIQKTKIFCKVTKLGQS